MRVVVIERFVNYRYVYYGLIHRDKGKSRRFVSVRDKSFQIGIDYKLPFQIIGRRQQSVEINVSVSVVEIPTYENVVFGGCRSGKGKARTVLNEIFACVGGFLRICLAVIVVGYVRKFNYRIGGIDVAVSSSFIGIIRSEHDFVHSVELEFKFHIPAHLNGINRIARHVLTARNNEAVAVL